VADEIAHTDFIETGEQYRRRRLFLAARSPLDVPDVEVMPVVDAPIFDEAKPADDLGRVEDLEAKDAELQRICDERRAVIDDLAEAAPQRLDLIEQLDGQCRAFQERLASYEGGRKGRASDGRSSTVGASSVR
jgi:hypothetical protein